MRKIITSAAVAAAAVALLGGTGIAAASSHSAATETESFQLMSTSATSTKSSVIACGAFTAPGVDLGGSRATPTTLTFANGTVQPQALEAGKGKQSFNPKTCLLTINETAPTRSAAAPAPTRDHRLGQVPAEHPGHRGAQQCGQVLQSKLPVAFHLVINASGPVSLP